MFQFVMNLWLLGKITEQQIDALVTNGKLTLEEANEIKAAER